MRIVLLAALVAIAAAAPGTAANVLANPGFETSPGTGPTSLTGGAGSTGASAAADWTAYNNTFATTTTALLPATDTISSGGASMLHIVTGDAGNGVYQFPTLFNFASVDVFVRSGSFQILTTNDYGAHADIATTSVLNRWQRLSVAFAGANEIVLYSLGGPADFYVDNVYGGDVPNPTPVAGGVPEPAA